LKHLQIIQISHISHIAREIISTNIKAKEGIVMSRKGFGAILLGLGVLIGGAYCTTRNSENLAPSTQSIQSIQSVQSVKSAPIRSAWWCTAFSIVCREATAVGTAPGTQEGTEQSNEGANRGGNGSANRSTTEESPIVFEWKLAEWWKSHFSP